MTLIDRHGPGNRLGSSGDESRITRSSHGADRHYPAWQRRSLEQWRELERSAGAQLFEPAGVVWLASEAQTFEADSYESLAALGIPVERWSPDELAARVPALNPDGLPLGAVRAGGRRTLRPAGRHGRAGPVPSRGRRDLGRARRPTGRDRRRAEPDHARRRGRARRRCLRLRLRPVAGGSVPRPARRADRPASPGRHPLRGAAR